MKHTKLGIGLLLALVLFAGGVYAKSSRLVWDQDRLAPESIAPGTITTFETVLRNTGPSTFETEHIGFEISGDVGSIMTVAGVNFPKKLKKGESVPVKFVVTVPASTPIGVMQGMVSLIRVDDEDEDQNEPSEKSKHKKVFLAKDLPVEMTVSYVLLPPDPGEEGKQDLLGIDLGGPDGVSNGVRDDIDRYIGLSYHDSAKTRMALTQYAREEQKVLKDADDKQKSIENIKASLLSYRCLKYILGYDIDKSSSVSSLLDAEILNTSERSRAETKASVHFGGQVIDDSTHEQDKSFCEINPDTLAN